MTTDAVFFSSWEGFLPPNAVVMGKRVAGGFAPHAGPAGAHSPEARPESFPLFFLLSEPLTAETSDLLQNILKALGFSSAQARAGTELPPGALPQVLVDMREAGASLGQWREESGASGRFAVIATHGLRSLVANPALKRETWSHLQAAAQRLGVELPARK